MRTVSFLFLVFGFNSIEAQESKNKVLSHWRFEQVQHLDKTLSPSIIGQPLSADEKSKPSEPQPYVFDSSGDGNFIQTRNSRPSTIVFSDNVPMTNGIPNTRSITLKKGEYIVPFERPLNFYDLQKSWTIEASLWTIYPFLDLIPILKLWGLMKSNKIMMHL